MLRENLKRVGEVWKKENLYLSKPLSESEIKETFDNLNISLSQDVIEVYSSLGGMLDYGCDSTCFSFWTIEELINENKVNSELVFFADFLIQSHQYCFKFEDEFVSSIHIYWNESEIEKIADSFDEFFENYLTNPEKYYLFEREA